MKSDFLVISDLHLERKSEVEKNFILNSINTLLENRKKEGFNTVVVCPGDVDNNIAGLAFLKKINSPVVYLCGNHEFWEHDYEEVKVNIKNNLPQNVYFLDNDFVIIDDLIYVGGTMWSDLGKYFNPDVFPYTKGVMNDEVYIKNKAWYQKPENIEKVKELYDFNSHKIIEQHRWNVFIEREENQKTINYFNNFIEVFSLLESIPTIENKLNYYIERNNSLNDKLIDKDEYKKAIDILLSYNKGISYENWITHLNKYLSDFSIKQNSIKEISEKEHIFRKLVSIPNLLNKIKDLKIVAVSHHLPFIEERLIGRQEWFDEKINTEYFNTLPDSIYAVRKGVDYNYHNYFYRIFKGEFDKDTAITHVLHYSNDGSSNFSPNLINKVYAWVHGHEHNYNYEDYLKGIKIITNPLSHSMAVFNFSQKGQVSLGKHYKSYHQISEQEEKEHIDKLANTFLRKPNLAITKENFKDAITLWSLKNFNWTEYEEEIDFLIKSNNKLMFFLLKNKNFNKKINDSDFFRVKSLIHSINYSIEKINLINERLNEGITMRVQEDYSLINKYSKTQKFVTISDNFSPKYIKSFDEFYMKNIEGVHDTLTYTAFMNIYDLRESKKKINKYKNLLNKFNVTRLSEIPINILDDFSIKYHKLNTEHYDFRDPLKRRDLENTYYNLKSKYVIETNKKALDF